MRKTSIPNSVKSFRYIKCYNLSSPRPVKTPSNSIRYNCLKICSWSKRLKTILEIRKQAIFLQARNQLNHPRLSRIEQESREFDLWKDSHSTKFKQRSRILIKLSFREFHETPTSEVIFVTLIENSSVVANDTQGPRKYPGTHFHARHGTKTTLVFLPADGQASRSLLPSLVSLLSCCTMQPENTYSYILRTLITATTSVHLPKSVSTDLTIKSNLVLTNPVGKDGVRGW